MLPEHWATTHCYKSFMGSGIYFPSELSSVGRTWDHFSTRNPIIWFWMMMGKNMSHTTLEIPLSACLSWHVATVMFPHSSSHSANTYVGVPSFSKHITHTCAQRLRALAAASRKWNPQQVWAVRALDCVKQTLPWVLLWALITHVLMSRWRTGRGMTHLTRWPSPLLKEPIFATDVLLTG